jgi:16S rRNA (guanine966-N2)-methyltransferase
MRVTGGILKGRILKTTPGLSTRPTTDKIRQSIFNILMNDIENAVVLDIFGGSGALGIEALSRGAASSIFIESGRKQVEVIQENLTTLGLKAGVFECDYIAACRTLHTDGRKFDLIFADPPYEKISPDKVAEIVLRYDLLEHNGLLIIEHKAGQDIKPDAVERLKKRKFGQTEVSFYARKKKD